MRFSTLSIAALAAGALAVPTADRGWAGSKYKCKCYPGDRCWPSGKTWKHLNETASGNLRVHIPPGAVCYNKFSSILGEEIETYDADACASVQGTFFNEQWTTDQPGANLWTYFTNDTCRPDVTSIPADTCTLGFYGVYVLTAYTKAHIKAAVDFARTNNVRLVIRNTGHDFIGRSTGWGSLILNTHHFKDINFTTSWSGAGDYTGGAVTIGAGVQARELLTKGHEQSPPVTVVVGECPTVGVAGGLVQGGGHGPLTTLHGFAADNALQFEVVTAGGKYLTVNEENNADLFWALKGGGPASYAVVVSATFKTYAEEKSAGIILNVNETHTTDYDTYWNAVRSFHKYSNHFVDSGLYVYFEMGGPFGGRILHIRPFVGVGKTAAEMEEIVSPFITELENQGIPYDKVTKEFDTLYDLYIDLFEDEYAGSSALTGGWMFTHQDVEENNDGIIEAFQTVVSPREDLAGTGWMVGHLWDAGHGMPVANSATHPKFRNATDFVISILPVPVGSTWEKKEDLQNVLTNVMDEALRTAGKYGATYVNEADPYQDNWQEHFWGDNYPALYKLKKKWDPSGVFYAISMPGTESWEMIEYGTRLCQKV